MKKIIYYCIINPEVGRVQILPLFTLTPQERLNAKVPLWINYSGIRVVEILLLYFNIRLKRLISRGNNTITV